MSVLRIFSLPKLLLLAPFVLLAHGPLHASEKVEAVEQDRSEFRKGIEAFKKKEFDAAILHLIKVPELGIELSTYKHWFLGQAYLETGKFKESEPEFAKVIHSQASSELKYQAQFYWGEVALRQRKYNEAIQRLAKLEKKWRKSYRYPEVLYRLMTADLRLNRTASACQRARKLYAHHPSHGLMAAWNHDLSSVVVDEKKLPCQASHEDFKDRVKSLQWSGESEKARLEIVERMSRAPENQKLSYDLILANYFVQEGSVDHALNLLMRHYPHQKTNFDYLMLLGKAAARSGEYQTAVGAYEKAHSLTATSRKGREALYQAAFLSYQYQDYDGAVRKFNKFIKANPRSGLARDANWHLAWLQYLRGDFKGAISRFQQVRKQLGRRGQLALREKLQYWMAMAYTRLKDPETARTLFQEIITNNPYSYYGFSAQARVDLLSRNLVKVPLEKNIKRSIASEAETSPNGEPAQALSEEENENEEALAESEDGGAIVPDAGEGGEVDESVQPSDFKDPAQRTRIGVAQNLIQLGLGELARWELWEVERKTRNPQYLKLLITAYESISSFHRSASISELSFTKEREANGIEKGRGLWVSMFPQAYKNSVDKFAKQYAVESDWIWSIMRAESLYRTDVISPVGAKGLMQLMPYTARNLSRLGGQASEFNVADLALPEVNIRLGTQYLARLQQKFRGQGPLVAAAYNAGPHRVESWLVNFGHLETDEFIEHIPFLETRNYVKKVVRNHSLYRRIYGQDVRPPVYLAESLGVPIPSRAATRENWESL